jgi:hypothetical protein
MTILPAPPAGTAILPWSEAYCRQEIASDRNILSGFKKVRRFKACGITTGHSRNHGTLRYCVIDGFAGRTNITGLS